VEFARSIIGLCIQRYDLDALDLWKKNEQANLTPAQIDLLRKIVEEEYP
jgi:hypothetical protein